MAEIEDSDEGAPGWWLWLLAHSRQVLAAWLGLGGAVGLVGTAWQSSSLSVGEGASFSASVPLLDLVPFAACMAVGYMLWFARSYGLSLATLVFSLQSVSFCFNDVRYDFSLLAAALVGVDDWALGLRAKAGSSFALMVGDQPDCSYFLINVLSVGAVALCYQIPRSGGNAAS